MDNKRVRKVAQCIQTLLEAEGTSISIKKVVEIINGEDLNNPVSLKEKVKKVLINNMTGNSDTTSFDRRQCIESFVARNWSQIKDNIVIRNVLFNAYCGGRIPKNKRLEMQKDLVKRCEDTVSNVVRTKITPPKVAEPEPKVAELKVVESKSVDSEVIEFDF